jgi:hypothetical protein
VRDQYDRPWNRTERIWDIANEKTSARTSKKSSSLLTSVMCGICIGEPIYRGSASDRSPVRYPNSCPTSFLSHFFSLVRGLLKTGLLPFPRLIPLGSCLAESRERPETIWQQEILMVDPNQSHSRNPVRLKSVAKRIWLPFGMGIRRDGYNNPGKTKL